MSLFHCVLVLSEAFACAPRIEFEHSAPSICIQSRALIRSCVECNAILYHQRVVFFSRCGTALYHKANKEKNICNISCSI